MIFVTSLTACSHPTALDELPKDTFKPGSAHEGELVTLGDLSAAYIHNTSELNQVNNQLKTICIAANRCEQDRLSDEE